MLKQDEREMLISFIGYHKRALIQVCTEKGVKIDSIISKINNHCTAANKFQQKPLREKEYNTLSRFLYDIRSEYFAWCNSYKLNQKHIDAALKRMTNFKIHATLC